MKKTIALFALLICTMTYEANCQVDIYLRDYKTYISPKKCKDSLIHYIKDSSFVEISLFNCKGKMSIKEFDQKGALLVIGQYEASLDTLKEYVDVFSLSGEIISVKVYKYFQPLRDGVWIFYENGTKKLIEKYKRGVLLKD